MTWPSASAARDAFVLRHRPPRPERDPWAAPEVLIEDEPAAGNSKATTLTVFLVGRECPWHCVMCDLWKQTVPGDTPPGAIPAQIAAACAQLERSGRVATRVKLYNAGSFFDPRAVPESDYPPIAAALAGFERVIVESHPALVGGRVDQWLALLRRQTPAPVLEVAMGLETAHPVALERLNKRMTLRQFESAAAYLRGRDVALRVFVLISPPFVPAGEQDRWLLESVDRALDCGASVISLIPTRGGNGALDVLAADAEFTPPSAQAIARSVEVARRRAGTRATLLLDPWSGS